MRSLRGTLAATAVVAGAFAALAGLVAAGALASLDQYAVDHWMHHLQPGGSSAASFASELFPKLGSPLQIFCNIWTYPASPVLASLVVAGCCILLARRGRGVAAAFAWIAAWALANGAELVGKSAIERPVLHLRGLPLHSFDSSFPSGHTLRALLLAAVVVSVWRRAALPLAVWVAVALPALVVNAAHTPSDVVGGVLLAAVAVLGVQAAVSVEPRRPRLRVRAAVAEQR